LSIHSGLRLLCALLILGTARTTAEGAPPQLTRRESPTTDDLHAVCFVDAAHGWILTHSTGRVWRTTDGGTTWKLGGELEEGYIEWIFFRDRDHGWLCGERGRLCATGDGGGSWQCRSEPGADAALSVVHFWDDEQGFASGMRVRDRSSVLFATEDGGRSWLDRSTTAAGRGMSDALVATGSASVLVGGFGGVWRATDRGADWSSVSVDRGAVVRGLATQPKDTLWAVGHRGLVLVSRDDGASWQRRDAFTDALLRGVVFASEKRGLIFGNRDGGGHTLWYTDDGGDSWAPVPEEFPALHRSAVTRKHIWLVGAGGAIYTLNRSGGEAE